ncbi:MAG: cation:proton antiporter, partial [Betaproteobacteria bacterium]
MLTATLLLLGVVLLAMCLLELHVTRLPMSPATVYLAVGWVAGAMVQDQVLLAPTAPQRADMLVIITETAVLISLFAVGLRLRTSFDFKGWRVAALLASNGMLATIVLATVVGAWLMPGLGWAGALLLAGILAPTDPVLASEVQIRSE